MKFFRGLFGGSRKSKVEADQVDAGPEYDDFLADPVSAGDAATDDATADEPPQSLTGDGATADSENEKSTMNLIRDINAKLDQKPDEETASGDQPSEGETASKAASSPGIWDLDDDTPDTDALSKPVSEPAPARTSARQRRTKTRLIGFDKSDGSSVDALNPSTVTASIEPAPKVTFPVGWILVVKGPGRGETFPLVNGLSSIGRGVDQTVRLDFGDTAISRSGHAALAYDEMAKTFTLGHGNKANIVRLNDAPVISNEPIKNGDHIRIGETTLRLVTLVGDDFEWSQYEDPEGDEDVAIA